MKTAPPFLVTATLLGFSLLPLTTNAATDRDAIKACSEAMIQKVETSTGNTVLDFEIEGELADSSASLRESTLYLLSAANSQTNTVIATARCVVSRHARIQSLKVLPQNTHSS